MKKLNEEQLKLVAEYTSKLEKARDEVLDAIQLFNNKMDLYTCEVQDAIDNYNNILEETNDNVIGIIKDDLTNFIEDHTEKWAESDTGQKYLEWLGDVEDIGNSLTEITMEFPSELDEPEMDHADRLNDLQISIDE